VVPISLDSEVGSKRGSSYRHGDHHSTIPISAPKDPSHPGRTPQQCKEGVEVCLGRCSSVSGHFQGHLNERLVTIGGFGTVHQVSICIGQKPRKLSIDLSRSAKISG
jgi:hypothetical protein